MSTITSNDFDFVTRWAKDQLVYVQKQFNREPNGINWIVCLRAMLVHQQISYAIRSVSVDKAQLLKDLAESPVGTWADVICLSTTGLSCDDALDINK